MGECAYYLKAEFRTASDAQIAAAQLDKFFLEAKTAHDFFQNERKDDPKKFWKTFSKNFPLVMDYVKSLPDYKVNCNTNTLSGYLDFGCYNTETLIQETVVCWGDDSVWHMADWTPLSQYVKQKYQAIKVVWDTEENGCGSLDSLQLYDWEQIVQDILKHKEIYPMLIGINEDLNTMLDIKSKGTPHAKKKSR